MTELKQRSKALSYWLRHAPEAGGLTLDPQGWAPTQAVLAALANRNLVTDMTLLEQVVTENDKQRFEFSENRERIRARQGHSIAVEGSWERAEPPAKLYHGTVAKFLEAIMREGLTPQKRHHVHLSPDIATASIVGKRRGNPEILQVDAAAMIADGHEFALSSNGVWLADAVAPQYLTRLEP